MDDSFTSKLVEDDETQLLPEILDSISLLRSRFPDQNIKALKWNDGWIAVPLIVDVELPGRGPVGGVDIRKREPIALLFERRIFPHRAPLVYSNRRDFPKTKFPHINVTAPKQPTWFCLHCGSIDAWFAEHDVYDLVQRARGRFRDAELLNDFAEKPESKGQLQRRLFGVLVWAAERDVSREYFGELPTTLGELVVWGADRGLPIAPALEEYLSNGFHLFAGVPVIVAVRRPRNIIGTNSDVELLNLLVTAGGDHWPSDGSWNLDAAVRLADHRTPLTPSFAQEISAITPENAAQPSLLFGAGALGSKVASHLARSGSVGLKIFDWAHMSPHNLVRHALGGSSIGKPKAEALKDELLKLYPGQKDLPIEASAVSVLSTLREENFAEGYRNLIDLTASNVVLNALRDAALPETLRVHRAEIAHRGKLGLLSIEGIGRSPRIDDLQTLIYDSAIEDDALAA